MNREFRKVTKNKTSLPTPDSALKLLFLKVRDLEKRYENRRMYNFAQVQYQLREMMDKRYGE